jgi:hypothetical protein
VAVTVRARASRRAVKQAVADAAADARAHKVAEPWVDWDNQHVGVSMLHSARLGKGSRMHLRETTRVEVS